MSNVTILTAENLADLLESNSITRNQFDIAKNLQNAIIDFPISISEPIDYLTELKREIGTNLTFDCINNYCRKLNPKSDAWKMESLSEVLEMFNENKNVTLDDLIIDVTNAYKNAL